MSKTITFIGILLLGLFCANINYLGERNFSTWRLDFTGRGLYTLSKGSKSILKKIQSPLTAKLYYAKTASYKGPESLRFYNNYFTYIKELLQEYESFAGRRNFRLEVIDPRPDTEDEEDALRYGLRRFPITEEENFFFGLAILNEAGNEEVIPFFTPDRQEFIEYDISKLLVSVNQDKRKRLGILSSLPVMGDDVSGFMAQMMRAQGKQVKPAWVMTTLLKQMYDVKKIEVTAEKIEDIDVLMVIHPKKFSKKIQYAIDQYVLGGGKALFFVDNYCYADQPAMTRNPLQSMVASRESSLNELFRGWGFEQTEKRYLGDLALAKSIPLQQFQTPQPFLGYLAFRKNQLNRKEVITSQLNEIELIFPTGFKKLANASASLTWEPLLETTDKGNYYSMDSYEFMQPDPQKMLDKFLPGKEKITAAFKLYGFFPTNFPDGKPTDEKKDDNKTVKEEKKEHKHLSKSVQETSIIVFGDVDFFTDNFAFTRSFFGPAARNENHSIVLNALENLSGSSDLIKIRARGAFKRPFTRIEKIQAKADSENADRIKELNGKIKKFQDDLNKMQSKANKDNLQILQAEALTKQKEVRKEIAGYQKKLRGVKRKRRQSIESLQNRLKNLNLFLLPLILSILCLFVWVGQFGSNKHYHPVARKAEEA